MLPEQPILFGDEPHPINPGIAAHSNPSLPLSDVRTISLFDLPQPGHDRSRLKSALFAFSSGLLTCNLAMASGE